MTEPLQPGQRLGAYRIIRPLGGGGMGQVYEAEHVSLGVRRALKVFTTESHHIDFLRKRFIAEGRILADLDHPRIVHVYDLVVDEETGTPYFAMDLVLSPDGTPRTLEDEREAGVSEEKVAMWFKDICEGLAYIHSHKVVHRDISLDNILIGPDGHAVISDFGIAKIVDDNYRRKINVTVTMASKDAKDLCMGKGNYMAPELKRGGKETPASDAYALGVLLFRLLTGFWYEPNRLEKTRDLLSGFEYDWWMIVTNLCATNPLNRLPPGGCASVAAILERVKIVEDKVPWWRMRSWHLILSACIVLIAVVGVYIYSGNIAMIGGGGFALGKITAKAKIGSLLPKLLATKSVKAAIVAMILGLGTWLVKIWRRSGVARLAVGGGMGLLAVIVAGSLCIRHDGGENRPVDKVSAAVAVGDVYDFGELFAIPPDAKEEEQVDAEGNVIVPSCEDLQRAQNDLWIITQDTFKELKSGKIKIEDAIADWKQLQRQFGDETDDAFDCWPGWYMQNGSNEAILWLLDQALILARELSVR